VARFEVVAAIDDDIGGIGEAREFRRADQPKPSRDVLKSGPAYDDSESAQHAEE
jgi:hypothetical protein